jgi:hypothetical protein
MKQLVRSIVAGVAVVGIGLACESSRTLSPHSGGPSTIISDGAHQGNAHFFFLPPMVKAPAYSGVFDPNQSPIVEICALASTVTCVTGPPIATYTKTSGTGGELVTMDPVAEQYAVKWRTKNFSIDPSLIYRISVKLGAVVIGYADVVITADNHQAKNVNTDEFIPLGEEQLLNIKFRLEQGLGIVIDATALTAPTLSIQGVVESFPSDEPQLLLLSPGTYRIRHHTAVAPGIVFVDFTVTASGTVDYSSVLDAVLSGRGTTSLTVLGLAITLDASALTSPAFHIGGLIDTDVPTAAVYALRVLPGPYRFQTLNAALYFFTVTPTGTVDYAVEDDDISSGRGTANLAIFGHEIQLNATALSHPAFHIGGINLLDIPTTQVYTFRLLPGFHRFQSQNAAFFFFTVTGDGKVEYAVEDDVLASGRGTANLTIFGREIQVDASPLSSPNFHLNGVTVVVPSDPLYTFRVLPGPYRFHTNTGTGIGIAYFDFTVTLDGNIDYTDAVDLMADGRNSPRLTVRGVQISIDATALTESTFQLSEIGTFPTSVIQSMMLLPGTYRILGSNPFDFQINPDGSVSFDASLTFLSTPSANQLKIQ